MFGDTSRLLRDRKHGRIAHSQTSDYHRSRFKNVQLTRFHDSLVSTTTGSYLPAAAICIAGRVCKCASPAAACCGAETGPASARCPAEPEPSELLERGAPTLAFPRQRHACSLHTAEDNIISRSVLKRHCNSTCISLQALITTLAAEHIGQ